ncbi:phage tail sheath protein FI/hydrogenase maturation factor [Bradyrhizobium sp. AZCC 2262]|uniref:phage tail sheath subtilisin-like domain-containing protein n=1 Tax=Bradyrhizobium sp. AZCC 2262 TaxID=3117022 RepID=UPI002FEF726E
MPEYLHPGVYIEETSYRGKPIQGVSTSTAGFVGAARKGPEGRAQFVSSFAQFRRLYGDPISPVVGLGDYLGHSVKSFFENGGARCYVVRVLPGDALRSQIAIEQGIVLKLAPGVTVRGPTRNIRLNALRGVGDGTILHVWTRPDANSPFAESRQVTVASYDATRNIVTTDAGTQIPGGVTLDPDNTVFLIDNGAPANALVNGGGPTFSARNRGVDGDRIAVEVRPRDRAPVTLPAMSFGRQDPLIDVAVFPLAAAQTTIEFTAPALRRMRTGDVIRIGANQNLTVQAIADGDVTFSVVGGGAGNDHTGGANILLVDRGGPLGTAVTLGAAPAAFAIDMTAGAGPFGPAALPHDIAMLLRNGDVVRVDTGGVTTDVSITAVRVAEEIAAGQHVTLAAPGLATAEAGPAEARITTTGRGNPVINRIFLGSVAGLAAPQRAGSLEPLSIAANGAADPAHVLLVDPANNQVFLATVAGEFPAAVTSATWVAADALGVAADGTQVVRVTSTASFYTGAKVELDTGAAKIELVVEAVDTGARTVRFTTPLALGAGTTIDLPADPAARHVYLRTCEIDVVISEGGVVSETFEGLTWNNDQSTDAGLRYYADRINDAEIGSALVTVAPVAPQGTGFAQAPVTANGRPKWLGGGSNGTALTDNDLIGSDLGPGRRTGIEALSERDDIAIVAVPGVTVETVQQALLSHAERLRYRIAVLDAPQNALDVVSLLAHRNNYSSKYGAYYAPWLKALNPINGRVENFPPSGYAAGIYARSDNTVGVHKAPANEVVRNITDVVLPFTAGEQDVLNPSGVNLIRDLTPRGIRLWGARTTTDDQEWKYVNIRRLFIFVEHSIDIGTQWIVFEPNSEALWARVVESITAFLIGVWKSGALMGTTPEEAFFVRCDRTTMTQDDIDNGRLVCEIGLAPVAPAEFVIFRIGQFTASAT